MFGRFRVGFKKRNLQRNFGVILASPVVSSKGLGHQKEDAHRLWYKIETLPSLHTKIMLK